jgi:hypothetical protein
VGDSIFNMEYGMKDNRGKYGMLDVKATDTNNKMLASTDIYEIGALADEQIGLINQAWSLLDPVQQQATYAEYKQKLEDIDAYVDTAGANPRDIKKADDKATADAIAVAVDAAITRAMESSAAALQAAAEKQERPVDVNVTVSAPAGSEVSIGQSNR